MESVVKHTPNTYYLELRQDYITLCMSLTYRKEKSKSSPRCKALILAIMEKWTNDKIGKKKDPHISMTYPQWIEEMYGLFGRSVIIDSLDELNHEELIARESYKSARGGRDQYKYTLNYELLNKSLNPTFTNQPCEEEQSVKVDDQGLQINVATSKNKRCSSSPTFKSKPFIESDTQNQNIKSEKESIDIRSSFFTSEELRMDTLYCHHYEDPPRLTKKLKGDYDKIAPHVKTQEDMESLIEYTEGRIKGDDPQAYPGNLARWVNSWKLKQEQDHAPLPWSQPNESSKPTEELDTAIETYAGHPLEYWTEEKMRDAQLTKIQRRTILRLQQEQITLVS